MKLKLTTHNVDVQAPPPTSQKHGVTLVSIGSPLKLQKNAVLVQQNALGVGVDELLDQGHEETSVIKGTVEGLSAKLSKAEGKW